MVRPEQNRDRRTDRARGAFTSVLIAGMITCGASIPAHTHHAVRENQTIVIAQRSTHACPAVEKPVCARDATGKLRTFGNECEARNAGATDVTKGACRRPQ